MSSDSQLLFVYISSFLVASNLITGYFFLRSRRTASALKEKLNQPGSLDYNATELLGELMKGGAVVVAQVIEPSTIFQWSPKEK